jgi:arylsulfatase
MNKVIPVLCLLLFFPCVVACTENGSREAADESAASARDSGETAREGARPNILLIVADDLGFSDVGAFGGEIRTPNLDTIAESGIRITDFHVGPTCAPSRSMLMSGNDNHLAGLGNQAEALAPNQKGQPGHEGYLNDRVISVASLLRDVGYHTYMAGKWHLGEPVERDPFHRGFERAFTLLQGGASHFADEWMMYANYTPTYRRDGQRVHLPPEFFSSEFYTDKIIEYIDSNDEGEPFFAYLAFTAPHDPLHVPDDWLDKYSGRYDNGWDALRAERLQRMEDLGIMPQDTALSRRMQMLPEWDSLGSEEKRYESRRMEIYAAMVENLDYHVGRLVDHLKRDSRYENTLILFFSDNGANAVEVRAYPETTQEWVDRNSDNRFENMGRRGSRIAQGMGWAIASNTPLRYFKGLISEGGIRSPLIVSGPGVARTGQIESTFTHVMDIAPTLLEVAGASYPSEYAGHEVYPVMGRSMMPYLQGNTVVVRDDEDAISWELLGYRAIRQGPWKATWLPKPLGRGDWELFNLVADVSERDDLATVNPERLRELIGLWEDYSRSVGVVLPEGGMELELEER